MVLNAADVHSSRRPHRPLEIVNGVTRPRVRVLLDAYISEMSVYMSRPPTPPTDGGHYGYRRFDEPNLDERFEMYALRDGRDVAGFVFLEARQRGLEVVEMFVEASYRRRRLGTLAVSAIKSMADERRLSFVVAHIYRANRRAIDFWKRQDFAYVSSDAVNRSELYSWPETIRPTAITGSW